MSSTKIDQIDQTLTRTKAGCVSHAFGTFRKVRAARLAILENVFFVVFLNFVDAYFLV